MFRVIDDLTADTVGAVLIAADVVDRPPLDLTVEPLGTGIGLLGTLARLRMNWPAGTAGPPTLVAKLPTTNSANQAIVDRFGYDRREAGVYRDLIPVATVPAPTMVAQEWDDEGGRGWLLLEDLGHLASGDQIIGATDNQARTTVIALASWHAAWWGDDGLGGFGWLPQTTDPVVSGYGEIFDLTWSMCVDRLGGVDPNLSDAAMTARRWFDTAVAEFATGDRTLVHGDARLDNVLFGADDATLLDFQLAARGRGAYDIAFFCAGSLTTNDRRRLESELLQLYRQTLAELDITVTAEELWRDYRLGHMLNLPNPVSAIAVVEPGDERGAEMLRRNAQRGLIAVADHVGLLEA